MVDTPRFDVHVHLAGVGTQGSGCWASPSFRRRPTFLGLRALLGIGGRQMETTVDQDWPEMISGLVAESDIDYAVALGFDGVYDATGALDIGRSQLIVPDDWVFEVCERYGNLLPAPSINPYAREAIERLEKAAERGAVLIKWLPIVQAFDPADTRARPFLSRVAELGIPLLVHAGGGEVTFATVDGSVGRVESLEPALELGVQVICAHSAAPVIYSRAPSELPTLLELMERYPNLWVDNSGIANPSRFSWLPRLADNAVISGRTLHGSDFPVISDAWYYMGRMSLAGIRRVQAERNAIQREVVLKGEIGFDASSFTRHAQVLANLDRWIGR